MLCPFPILDNDFIKRYHINKYFGGHNIFYAAQNTDKITFSTYEMYRELIALSEYPSTGLALLFWLKKTVGLKKVQLFGFDFFSNKQSHHYYEKVEQCTHTGDVEKKLVEGWF